ncbi:hypothetical protein [Legionella sainthelensi]|uniref:hypothetical protein n=1 Tax=Legionella sainthelensi TaxID=28087 RepID=UPI000A5235D9|nr:hypothetical protein [Legionella sainthelensi]VEH31937.1 cation efflux transporter [Legionella sainthelensi]
MNPIINEAPLTGELVSVEKHINPLPEETPISHQRNRAFMGTNIVNAHGYRYRYGTELGYVSQLTNTIT